MSDTMQFRIKPEWAGQQWGRSHQIWDYNKRNGEDIHKKVALPLLGGLVVAASIETYSPNEVAEIAGRHSLINLAFSDYARLTSTEWLLEAALTDGTRPQLIRDLQVRQRPDETHGPDETWVLPLWGLELAA